MIHLFIKRGRIYIDGDFDQLDTINIQGFKADYIQQIASCNLDIDAVDSIIKQTQKKDRSASDEVKRWYKEQYFKRKNALNAHSTKNDLKIDNLNKELKNYQIKAVNFFNITRNCIVSYDMGLGKTLISINAIKLINANKTLVVCPAYLKYSYANELKKWSPELSFTLIDGTKEKREKQFNDFKNNNKNVLIINYEQIRIKKSSGKKPEIFVHPYIQKTKFDLLICDEAHKLKNKDSQISQGIYAINTQNRLLLTGTPITKNEAEIFSLLRILDRKRFRSYWTFVDYYCSIEPGEYGYIVGKLRRKKEYHNLMKQYMIRKLKQDVAKELPPKVKTNIPVYMYPEQKNAYDKAMKEFINPDNSIIASDVERFIRLCQINQNPCILDGEDISISRDTVIHLIQDMIPQRVLVVCTYIKMSENLQTTIQKQFKDRKVYLHNSKVKEREKVIAEFKNDDTGIFVATVKSLAEGHNLDECDVVIFVDIDWNCGTNAQFENRIHRMTSTNTKYYYYIIVKDTVNEYKFNKILTEANNMKIALNDSRGNVMYKMMSKIKLDNQ